MTTAVPATSDSTWSFFGWVVAVAGLAAVFAPSALGVDMMRYGYGLAMIGLFVAVCGCVTALMFRQRARLVSRVFNPPNLLAHWTYPPEQWARYTVQEHERHSRDQRGLLLLVGVIMVLVGGGFALLVPDGRVVLLPLAGLFALLSVIAIAAPKATRARNRRRGGEAYIARSGAWLAGDFHAWTAALAHFDGAEWLEGDPPTIAITYSVVNRVNEQQVAVRIPVPSGREEEARRVIAELQSGRPVVARRSSNQTASLD